MEPSQLPPLPDGVDSPELLLHFMDRFRAGQYLTVASFTFLVYDHLITLPDEVQHIWLTAPYISLAKSLFYIIRYLSPALLCIRMTASLAPTDGLCEHGLAFSGYGAVANLACVEVVLMLRVWALYGKSKRIGIFFICILCLAFLACILVVRFIGITGEREAPFLAAAAPASLAGCVGYGATTKYFGTYLVALVVECIVFTMMIARAWNHSRDEQTPIVTALIRHGSIYFAVVFLGLLLAIISFTNDFLVQPFVNSNICVAIAGAACSRLILSLRGVYSRSVRSGLPTKMTGTTLDWGQTGDIPFGTEHTKTTMGLSAISELSTDTRNAEGVERKEAESLRV